MFVPMRPQHKRLSASRIAILFSQIPRIRLRQCWTPPRWAAFDRGHRQLVLASRMWDKHAMGWTNTQYREQKIAIAAGICAAVVNLRALAAGRRQTLLGDYPVHAGQPHDKSGLRMVFCQASNQGLGNATGYFLPCTIIFCPAHCP